MYLKHMHGRYYRTSRDGRKLREFLMDTPNLAPVSKLFFNPVVRGIPRSVPKCELERLVRKHIVQKIGHIILIRSKIRL